MSVLRSLLRRKDYEAHTFIDQHAHHFIVTCRFRQPHCLGLAIEPMSKIR